MMGAAVRVVAVLLVLVLTQERGAQGTIDQYSAVKIDFAAPELMTRELRVRFVYSVYGRAATSSLHALTSNTVAAAPVGAAVFVFPTSLVRDVDYGSVLSFQIQDVSSLVTTICGVDFSSMVQLTALVTPGSTQVFIFDLLQVFQSSTPCSGIASVQFTLRRTVPTSDPASICDGCQACDPRVSVCHTCVAGSMAPSFHLGPNFGCLTGTFPECLDVVRRVVCQACPAGSFCPGSGFALQCSSAEAMLCAPGSFQVPCSASSNIRCDLCPSGMFCAGGTSPAVPCTRASCPAGEATADNCSSTCLPCPADMFCPAGNGGPQRCSTPSCAPGMQATGCREADSVCSAAACGGGTTFCPGGTAPAQACTSGGCIPGFAFSPCTAVRNSICTPCPENSFCLGGTAPSIVCSTRPCPPGQAFVACTTAVDSACVACPVGSFCPGGTTTAQPCSALQPCALGTQPTVCQVADNTCSAVGCGGGTTFCPGGTAPAQACSRVGCTPGLALQLCTATNDSFCAACPPNSFCPGGSTPALTCTDQPCAAGEGFIPCTAAADARCVACPDGHFCPGGTTAAQPCTARMPCPQGMQLTECRVADRTCSAVGCGNGTTFCPGGVAPAQACTSSACNPGFAFSPCTQLRNSICTPCPSNSFCPGGMSAATACSAAFCKLGEAHAACTTMADAACEACPTGSFCPGGSSAATLCSSQVCTAGEVLVPCNSTADRMCAACPAGSFCPGPTTPVMPCTVCSLAGLEQDSPCTSTEDATCSIDQDSTPPVLTLLSCPGLATINCSWQAGVPFVFGGGSGGFMVSDNSNPNPTVAVTGTVDVNNVGVYIITYVASDGSPNSADVELTRIVTVGNDGPTIVFRPVDQAVTVVEAGNRFQAEKRPGVLYVDATDSDATLRNRATVTGLAALDRALSIPFTGVFLLSYEVTDTNNNRASRERQVEVRDTTPPILTRAGPTVTFVPQTRTPVPFNDTTGILAVDIVDKDLRPTLTFASPFDSTVARTYAVTYSAVDSAGNAASLLQHSVVVEDRTAPVFSYTPQDTVLEADATNTTYQPFEALTATDDVDGPVEVFVTVTDDMLLQRTGSTALNPFVDKTKVGKRYFVEYDAADAAGNKARETQRIQVVDSLPPAMRLLGPATVTLALGAVFKDPGAEAVDRLSGRVETTADPPGPYTQQATSGAPFEITYTAEDQAGNVGRTMRTVAYTSASSSAAPGGMLIGIGAAVAVVLALALLVGLLWRRRRGQDSESKGRGPSLETASNPMVDTQAWMASVASSSAAAAAGPRSTAPEPGARPPAVLPDHEYEVIVHGKQRSAADPTYGKARSGSDWNPALYATGMEPRRKPTARSATGDGTWDPTAYDTEAPNPATPLEDYGTVRLHAWDNGVGHSQV